MNTQLADSNGSIEATLQIDEMKESLDQLRQDLVDDLQSKLQALKISLSLEAEQNEENKEEDDAERDPLIIIAENNKLNLIDQGMEYVVK